MSNYNDHEDPDGNPFHDESQPVTNTKPRVKREIKYSKLDKLLNDLASRFSVDFILRWIMTDKEYVQEEEAWLVDHGDFYTTDATGIIKERNNWLGMGVFDIPSMKRRVVINALKELVLCLTPLASALILADFVYRSSATTYVPGFFLFEMIGGLVFGLDLFGDMDLFLNKSIYASTLHYIIMWLTVIGLPIRARIMAKRLEVDIIQFYCPVSRFDKPGSRMRAYHWYERKRKFNTRLRLITECVLVIAIIDVVVLAFTTI